MTSIYRGLWLPGQTKFTGSSFMTGYHIEESKTLFTVPEWSPIWKYKSFGFQHHVARDNGYDLQEVEKLMKHYRIKESLYEGDSFDLREKRYITDPKECNVEPYTNEGMSRMLSAHNQAGDYVGDLKTAHFLMSKGIYNPIKSHSVDNVCSIGYSETDKKWFGWSHRAIFGFKVDSTVKKGDCAYVASTEEEFVEDCVAFWSDDDHINVKGVMEWQEREQDVEDCVSPVDLKSNQVEATVKVSTVKEYGCQVNWEYDDKIPNEKLRGQISGVFSVMPKLGKGEWTAKTMEDAKQMAIDFASGVS